MSYRQLLDPKGFAKDKSKKGAQSNGPSEAQKSNPGKLHDQLKAAPKFDPKALLNPKLAAGRSRPSTSRMDDTAPNGTSSLPTAQSGEPDSQPGLGGMIERLNNVGARETPLSTKRKADAIENDDNENEDYKKSKTAFVAPDKGSILSEYRKSELEKGAAESKPVAEAIDLTNDDDDCVITGEVISEKIKRENQEVCLGRLVSHASAFRIPSARQSLNLNSDFWPGIKISYRKAPGQNSIIELFDRSGSGTTGVKFANLEGKMASLLSPLLTGVEVSKFKMKMYLHTFKKQAGEYPNSRISRALRLDIEVYAPRKMAEGIGKLVSQKQVFFNPPYHADQTIEVYNPHALQSFAPATGKVGRPQASQPVYGIQRTQEEVIREAANMFDSLTKTEDIPEMEADVNLIFTPLLSHQKQALRFLTEHERGDDPSKEAGGDDALKEDTSFSLWRPRDKNSGQVWYNIITNHESAERPIPARGGILADVMGLGKTLSILALIAETIKDANKFGNRDPPTQDEAIKRNVKATLIICPKSVMANWHEQIKTHTKPKRFKVYSYHGTNRTNDVDELAGYNIVLTTYNTAGAEFSDTVSSRKRPLASINWFRIVLDEAHQIRNPSTKVSKACCALSAERRWAVTGTPVQNRLEDLGALIRFLKIKPFDDSTSWNQHIIAPFKNADETVLQNLRLLVDGITLRRQKDKIGLTDRFEERERLEFSDEELVIYSQFARASSTKLRLMTAGRDAYKGKTYAHVLKWLARLRAICAHGIEMLNEEDQKELEGMTAGTAIDLGDEPDFDNPTADDSFIGERTAYDTLNMMIESEVDVCQMCARKIGDKKTDPIDGTEEDLGDSGDEEVDEEIDGEKSDDDGDLNGDIMGYLTPCYHLICPRCKDAYNAQVVPNLTEDHYHACFLCESYVIHGLFTFTRSGLKRLLDSRSAAGRKERVKWDESNYSGPHTKVKALLDDLHKSGKETAALPPEEPPIRSVVFSGWTTYLDLIEVALEHHGHGFVRLDGSMSIKARSAVLATFASDPTVTVLLVSIKAGGQGLNFVSANKVYMMEPQWNPGVEQQAIDRVHRLGQKRDVRIKHYVMRDSVEEKILLLQEKKRKLAEMSLERKMGAKESARQRMQDMRELFK